jgi:hypothetical protein
LLRRRRIYNLQHPELSNDILADKMASIKGSGRHRCHSQSGYIMQIGAGVLLNQLDVDVVHPIELLDAAYAE